MKNNDSELKKLNTVKESLEDINLFLPELEKTTLELISAGLTDDPKESSYLSYKLRILEQYIENLNKKVQQELGVELKNARKLS
ncbi:MAG: hypothetical protein N3C60_00575 [Calditerrivibrio sp.]|nr:hypothetical protein [Calditerrivibrio sp.]